MALVATLALSLTACDNFLDQEPTNAVPSESVFNDVTGAEAAIAGAYNRLQGPMDDFVIFSDLAAEYANHTGSFPSWTEVDVHNVTVNNAEASGQFAGWYALINQTNLILENVDNAQGISQGRANEIKGEAYAIRAWAYHALVRWFGGVPIVLRGAVDLDNLNVPRNSRAEVYAQILSDLEAAEPLVAEAKSVGLVDRDVVRALRARVLLYDGQFEQAGQIAAELYDKYPLATLESVYDGLNSSESIWELQYTTDDQNSMSFFAFVTGGRYEYGPTPDAVAAFGEEDGRAAFNIAVDGTTPIIAKYFRVNTDDDHHFLIRGAEMALIEAEVAARAGNAGDAVDILNEIRTRASAPLYGVDNDEDGTLDGDANGDGSISADEAFDLVIAERGLELAYEGHRWHDLVRIGEAVERLPSLSSENFTLWPIPQSEIDRNSAITQNPGY